MEETKHEISMVPMEQYYSKENGIVYWNWRIGNMAWQRQETPYEELPFVPLTPK